MIQLRRLQNFPTADLSRAALVLLCLSLQVPRALHASSDFGVDVLRKTKFAALKNAKVALITNHTGLSKTGDSTLDVFLKSNNVTLKCILAPEHGFAGKIEHGKAIADQRDEASGLTVFSLYGENSRPNDIMLQGVDTIVFDIQDVGTRFYTYVTTMGMAMEEAAKRNLKFVVLDRPNPIRGDIVEGDVLDADIHRMTGYFRIPVRHGLTVGELATWFNQTQDVGAELIVIPMTEWRRSEWFDETDREFIPPSPNIRNLSEALLYPGIGCFEATNISVGRGTDMPFEVFGAPWLESRSLCAYMRQFNFKGVTLQPVVFTPNDDLYATEKCNGIRIVVTDRNQVRAFKIFVAAFCWIYKHHPNNFKPVWEEVRVVTGTERLHNAVLSDKPVEDLFSEYDKAASDFFESAKGFLLYK